MKAILVDVSSCFVEVSSCRTLCWTVTRCSAVKREVGLLLTPYVFRMKHSHYSRLLYLALTSSKWVHIYMHGKYVELVRYLMIFKKHKIKLLKMCLKGMKIHRHFLILLNIKQMFQALVFKRGQPLMVFKGRKWTCKSFRCLDVFPLCCIYLGQAVWIEWNRTE